MEKKTHQISKTEAGMRLDRWFKQYYPGLSQATLQKMLRKGDVRVNGKKAEANSRLEAGDEVRVSIAPGAEKKVQMTGGRRGVSKEEAESFFEAYTVYKDDKLIAINKPAGIAVQGGSKVNRSVDAMLEVLAKTPAERGRLVHRIDKDTSGILLIARNAAAARELTAMFREREMTKIYWAIVVGAPDPKEGVIKARLSAKSAAGNTEKTVVDEEDGKYAVSHYRIMEKAAKSAAWVALYPYTGRTHQLRVHMNYIGTPILGDGKYGGSKAFINRFSNQLHLHARKIIIPGYNKGKDLVIRAPLSEHMERTFDMLGFTPKREDDTF